MQYQALQVLSCCTWELTTQMIPQCYLLFGALCIWICPVESAAKAHCVGDKHSSHIIHASLSLQVPIDVTCLPLFLSKLFAIKRLAGHSIYQKWPTITVSWNWVKSHNDCALMLFYNAIISSLWKITCQPQLNSALHAFGSQEEDLKSRCDQHEIFSIDLLILICTCTLLQLQFSQGSLM